MNLNALSLCRLAHKGYAGTDDDVDDDNDDDDGDIEKEVLVEALSKLYQSSIKAPGMPS